MRCFQPTVYFLLVILPLALAIGCGGDEKTDSASSDAIPAPSSPIDKSDSPQAGELQSSSPTDALDPFPKVEFQTAEGNFTVVLNRRAAPKTVENFLKYVDGGFYNGTVFHQAFPDYAVVGGNYSVYEDGQMRVKGGRGEIIPNEANNGLLNKRGTIGMTREDKKIDSSVCEFYINLADNIGLDYREKKEGEPEWQTAGYCVFGEVEGNGIEVLEKIAEKDVTTKNGMDRVLIEPVEIKSTRRLSQTAYSP